MAITKRLRIINTGEGVESELVKAMVFLVVMYRCESWTVRRLNTEELMLLNCGAGEHY